MEGDNEVDDFIHPLLVDVNNFIEKTGLVMGDISNLVNRPTIDDEDCDRLDYWKNPDRDICKSNIENWGNSVAGLQEKYWEHYLDHNAHDFSEDFVREYTNKLDLNLFYNDFDKTLDSGLSKQKSNTTWLKNIRMLKGFHGRDMRNKFYHFGDFGSTGEAASIELLKKNYDQLSNNYIFDIASAIVQLFANELTIQLSEKLESFWREKYPMMNYRSEQVLRRLQELEWDHYLQDEGYVNDIAEMISGYPIVCLHGDGGIGKTALAYEIIRRNGNNRTPDLPRFEYIAILTTRTSTQGIFRTMNPRKGRRKTGTRAYEAGISISPNDNIDNSFREFIRCVCEAAGVVPKHVEPEIETQAIDILKNQRILVLLDNYEDIQKDGYEEVLKKFEEFLKKVSKGGAPKTNGRIVITTRINDKIGHENREIEVLRHSQATELAIKRYEHLTNDISHPYDSNPQVVMALTSLRNDPDELNRILDQHLGEYVQNWGHPLLVFLITWYMADLGGQNRHLDEKLILRRVFSEIDENGKLKTDLIDLAKWTTNVSIGFLPDEWLNVFWLLVELDKSFTEGELRDMYKIMQNEIPLENGIIGFRRALESTSFVERTPVDGEWRFKKVARERLADVFKERLEKWGESEKSHFNQALNEYSPMPMDQHYNYLEQELELCNEILEELMDNKESSLLKSAYFPKTILNLKELLTNPFNKRNKIDPEKILLCINISILIEEEKKTGSIDSSILEKISGLLIELNNNIDEGILKLWARSEEFSVEIKAEIISWISSRFSTSDIFENFVDSILSELRNNIPREQIENLHFRIIMMLKAIEPIIGTDETRWHWCEGVRYLFDSGAIIDPEYLSSTVAENIALVLRSKEIEISKDKLLDLLRNTTKCSLHDDMRLSENVLDCLRKESEIWDAAADDFDIKELRRGDTVIWGVIIDGTIEGNYWEVMKQGYKVRVKGVPLKKNKERFLSQVVYIDPRSIKSVFLEWIEDSSELNGKSLDVEEHVNQMGEFVRLTLETQLEDFRKGRADDLFMLTTELAQLLKLKFKIDESPKSHMKRCGFSKPYFGTFIKKSSIGARIKYRSYKGDNYHSVRVQSLDDDDKPEWTGLGYTSKLEEQARIKTGGSYRKKKKDEKLIPSNRREISVPHLQEEINISKMNAKQESSTHIKPAQIEQKKIKDLDNEISVLTFTALNRAINIVTDTSIRNNEFLNQFIRVMKRTNARYSLFTAKLVVSQFKCESENESIVCNLDREKWIDFLRQRFSERFKGHSKLEKLLEVLSRLCL